MEQVPLLLCKTPFVCLAGSEPPMVDSLDHMLALLLLHHINPSQAQLLLMRSVW